MKYLKTYEKINNVFYLISTKNLIYSLKNINLPKYMILDILNVQHKIVKQPYAYIGINPTNFDRKWGWMPLKSERPTGESIDGNYIYLEGGYKFAGYDNLTKREIEEVKEIRKEIEIERNTKKYNL